MTKKDINLSLDHLQKVINLYFKINNGKIEFCNLKVYLVSLLQFVLNIFLTSYTSMIF